VYAGAAQTSSTPRHKTVPSKSGVLPTYVSAFTLCLRDVVHEFEDVIRSDSSLYFEDSGCKERTRTLIRSLRTRDSDSTVYDVKANYETFSPASVSKVELF